MQPDGEGPLPAELEAWVESRAAEEGLSREAVIARAVAAYRYLTDAEAAGADGLDALEERFDEQVEDIRERVVEVLRTAESKAPADHDHPELAADIDAVSDQVDAVSDRVDGGFDNYESILAALRDRTDDLGEETDRLAEFVDVLDGRLDELEAAAAAEEAVDELKRTANVEGVSVAACENCGNEVRIGLLSEPNCPHCESPFDGVEPAQRFFSSATLSVSDRPALTTEGDEADGPPSPLAEAADVESGGSN